MVVLGGRGTVFSAGADLDWMKTVASFGPEENAREARVMADLFFALDSLPKPVVARVHGAALGGGTGLVAASDPEAELQETYNKLGSLSTALEIAESLKDQPKR
mgnify:CR=1 FL=1